jgi:hypothetical protein
MTYKGIMVAVAACAGVAFTDLPVGGDLVTSKAYADGAKKIKKAKSRPKGVRVRGFLQRGGYYSYMDADAVNSYAWSSSLFTSKSTFRNPRSIEQSPGGPFDSGFFFDSDIGPPWNNAPYPR